MTHGHVIARIDAVLPARVRVLDMAGTRGSGSRSRDDGHATQLLDRAAETK
jgi:hypothetical protein